MEKISSLYIHFPYCKNACNYCDFYKHESDSFEGYEELLEEQYKKMVSLFREKDCCFTMIDTIYIGGGTPSLWSFKGIEYLRTFLKRFDISPSVEFTIEANPSQITPEELSAWQSLGVNRLSIGVQALSDNHLELLDRTHRVDAVKKTLSFVKSSGINYSVDFLLGIPDSTTRNIINELKEILEFGPSHLSVYILTVGERYPLSHKLPSEEEIVDEYLCCSEYLSSKGFTHYEVSNFSLLNRESQHNLAYWKTKSVAALGPSATGLLAQDNCGVRYKWGANLDWSLENLNSEQLNLERIYMRLRTNLGSDVPKALRDKWYKNGYLVSSSSPVRLNSKGYLVLDSLMSELF